MLMKLFEIRDRGTFSTAFAFRPLPHDDTNRAEDYLLIRAGWGDSADQCVYLGKLDGRLEYQHDPSSWPPSSARTMGTAHHYIAEHFDELQSGTVIDVEFIKGETNTPKESESEDINT